MAMLIVKSSDVLVQSAAGGSSEIFDDEESYRDAEVWVNLNIDHLWPRHVTNTFGRAKMELIPSQMYNFEAVTC